MLHFSDFILPASVCTIIIYGLFKNIDVFSTFISGAKQGIQTSINILPSIIALMVAISMFRASGALDILISVLSPLTDFLHIPKEIVPLSLLRPLSGSGSLTVFKDIITNNGPDSFIGRAASIIQGSSETTFYTIAVYYGSLKISNSRHTAFCSLIGDITGLLAGLMVTRIFFA